MDRPPAVIDTDLPCAQCGYNLLGLASGGRCPECATPVALSWIRRLPPQWGRGYARRLEVGARLLQFGVVGTGICGCGCFLQAGAPILTFAPLAVAAVGCWLLVTRPPDADPGLGAPARTAQRTRTAARALLIIAGLIAAFEIARLFGLPRVLKTLGLPAPARALSGLTIAAALLGAYALTVAHTARLIGPVESMVRRDAPIMLWATALMSAFAIALLAAGVTHTALGALSALLVNVAGVALVISVPAWLLLHVIFFDRVAMALAERLARVE